MDSYSDINKKKCWDVLVSAALENSPTKIKFIVADYLNSLCSVGDWIRFQIYYLHLDYTNAFQYVCL